MFFLCLAPSRFFTFFFFNDTATTEIYTLSLHDALPIFSAQEQQRAPAVRDAHAPELLAHPEVQALGVGKSYDNPNERSGEHTSELQSPCNLVCRLLLEKKKKSDQRQPNSAVSPALSSVQ